MSVNNLYINCVPGDYCMIELFDLFYTSGIATVSEIYYVPYYDERDGMYNYHVYITIHNWHDTDAAYNFHHKLTLYERDNEARIVYDDDNWFAVSVAPVYRAPYGYSIINYLVQDDDSSFQTLDLGSLPVLDKELDLLTM